MWRYHEQGLGKPVRSVGAKEWSSIVLCTEYIHQEEPILLRDSSSLVAAGRRQRAACALLVVGFGVALIGMRHYGVATF